MREIKFRAWDKEMNQMWNAGDFHLSSDGFAFTCSGGFDCDACPEKFILMQYTGLKDKNGKEIYEGDVVLCDNEFYAPVLWNDKLAQWCIHIGHTFEGLCEYCNCHIAENCEVVGNIHDNPELLEEEE